MQLLWISYDSRVLKYIYSNYIRLTVDSAFPPSPKEGIIGIIFMENTMHFDSGVEK